jgi:hypothetical protein
MPPGQYIPAPHRGQRSMLWRANTWAIVRHNSEIGDPRAVARASRPLARGHLARAFSVGVGRSHDSGRDARATFDTRLGSCLTAGIGPLRKDGTTPGLVRIRSGHSQKRTEEIQDNSSENPYRSVIKVLPARRNGP